MMQAVIVHEYGAANSVQPEAVPMPKPGENQVRIKVEAAGVGYVDALMVEGLYQIKPPVPWAAGMEFAGVVDALGSGDTAGLAIGDAVTGSGSGALAEYMTVAASACIPRPEALPAETASGFWVNHATALLGLDNCGHLQPGETVLILGAAGGVGSSAISVAKAMGGHVIAAASTPEKLAFCEAAGADETIDYSNPEWRNELKSRYPNGIDIAYDPVGGDFTDLALRSMAPGGRLLIVGFATGTIPSPRLNLALLKRCSIVGVNWGGESSANPEVGQQVLDTLVAMVNDGSLIPAPVVTHPLAETGAALQSMLDRKTVGKVVITL